MALAGLIVAVCSGLLAILVFVTNRSAIKREQEDRRVALEFQASQVQAQIAALSQQGTALLSAVSRGSSGGKHFDRYTFELMNAGPAVAEDPRAWVIDENEEKVAGGHPIGGQALPPASKPVRVEIDVERALSRTNSLRLLVTWRDGNGDQGKVLLLLSPPTRLS